MIFAEIVSVASSRKDTWKSTNSWQLMPPMAVGSTLGRHYQRQRFRLATSWLQRFVFTKSNTRIFRQNHLHHGRQSFHLDRPLEVGQTQTDTRFIQRRTPCSGTTDCKHDRPKKSLVSRKTWIRNNHCDLEAEHCRVDLFGCVSHPHRSVLYSWMLSGLQAETLRQYGKCGFAISKQFHQSRLDYS